MEHTCRLGSPAYGVPQRCPSGGGLREHLGESEIGRERHHHVRYVNCGQRDAERRERRCQKTVVPVSGAALRHSIAKDSATGSRQSHPKECAAYDDALGISQHTRPTAK